MSLKELSPRTDRRRHNYGNIHCFGLHAAQGAFMPCHDRRNYSARQSVACGRYKGEDSCRQACGITDIILSVENRKDVEDIDAMYISGLTFHYVKTVMEVIDKALLDEKVAHCREL